MERERIKEDEGLANEESLDPKDWEEFRSLAHRMLDDMLDHLSTLRDRPAWQPVPQSVRTHFTSPLPKEPQDAAEVYQEFLQNILPYTNGNRHPRFWGWVQGNGTPLGMLADMLASGMNPHLAGFDQAPLLVEQQVIGWLTELMGMPAGTSGILVSGGTMANITGLAVASPRKSRLRCPGAGASRSRRAAVDVLRLNGNTQLGAKSGGAHGAWQPRIPPRQS